VNNPLKLIVGLGNPGSQYQSTRHNAGEDFVESLARRFSGQLNMDNKHYGKVGEILVNNKKVRLLIPTTFMNKSGQSVAALAHFFKIEPQEILVAHDELDMPPGVCKLKFAGGHGGHNGLRDIISRLGNSRDFYRLRIGIGHPGSAKLVSDYVLKKASPDDRILIETSSDKAISVMPECFDGHWEQAMKTLHTVS